MACVRKMDDATMVLTVYHLVVLGVKATKVFTKALQSFFLVATFHLVANIIANGGDIIDAIAYRINIHHASSRKDLDRRCGEQCLKQLHDFLFVHRSIIVVVDALGAYEIVVNLLHLLNRRGGRANPQFLINLT